MSRLKMSSDEAEYNRKRKQWFDTIYPLLKIENLTKDQIAEVGNKISELALHLINNKNESN